MNERIFFQIPFYAISQAILLGLPVLVTPLILRILPPEQYGMFEAGAALILFVNSLVSLEIVQALQRLHPEYEPSRRRLLLNSSVLYTVCAYGLVFILLSWLGHGKEDWAPLIGPFVLLGASQGIFMLFAVYLRLEASSLRYLIILAVYAVIFLFAHFILFYQTRLGSVIPVSVILHMQAALAFLGCLICAWASGRGFSILGSTRVLKEMLAYSFPLSLATIPVYCLGALEVWFITTHLGRASIGSYSAAARTATVVNLFAAGTQAALIPGIFSRSTQSLDVHSHPVHEVLRSGLIAFELYAVPFLIVVMLFGREILDLVFPYSTDALLPVFGLLMLAFFIGRLSIFFPGIEVTKKTKTIFLLQSTLLVSGFFAYLLVSKSENLVSFAFVTLGISVLRLLAFAILSRSYVGWSFRRTDWVPILFILGALGVWTLVGSLENFHPISVRVGLGLGLIGLYFLSTKIVRKI